MDSNLEQKKLDVIKQVLKDCYPQSIIYPKFTNDAKKILSALKKIELDSIIDEQRNYPRRGWH